MGRAHEVRKAAMARLLLRKLNFILTMVKEIYFAEGRRPTEPDGNLSLRRLIEKSKENDRGSWRCYQACD